MAVDSNPTQDQNAINRPNPTTPPATPFVLSALAGLREDQMMPSGPPVLKDRTAVIVSIPISQTSTTPRTLAATEMSLCDRTAITATQPNPYSSHGRSRPNWEPTACLANAEKIPTRPASMIM